MAGANLEEAHFAGVLLQGAELRRKNLRAERLREARLEGVDLTGAFLKEANLSRADLIGANFEDADLERADLEGADLRGANLRHTNLAEANLRDAMIYQANLIGALLHKANLEGIPETAILHIPLRKQVLARDLGGLLSSLADIYSVAHEIGGTSEEELVARRITVGTPNIAELIGMLPQTVLIASALLTVLKLPRALGEAAKEIAEARTKWYEGTRLKKQIGEDSRSSNHQRKIKSAFHTLAEVRPLISSSAEPTVWVRGSEAPEIEDEEEMPKGV